MNKQNVKRFTVAAGIFAAFVLWSLAVCFLDVSAIGPQESEVGFSHLNGAFHDLTNVHMDLYVITDWLGLVPFAFVAGFGVLGLVQWIRRRKLRAVDFDILVLGGFYIVTMAAYVLFEYVKINYRPVLINGYLEVSYPSSTTMLVLCVMPTAMLQFHDRIKNKLLRSTVNTAIAAFTVFMVIGRLISGVHWLSDIIGGILLSGALVSCYYAVAKMK